jgi:F0F1-type ATP synthase epsilon subunit
VRSDGKEKVVVVFGGFLHIAEDGNVTVLADNAEHIEEINEKFVIEAVEKAKEVASSSKEGGLTEESTILAETQAELLRNLTRLKAVQKHRSHHGIKYEN